MKDFYKDSIEMMLQEINDEDFLEFVYKLIKAEKSAPATK